jgi:hypothetical protein
MARVYEIEREATSRASTVSTFTYSGPLSPASERPSKPLGDGPRPRHPPEQWLNALTAAAEDVWLVLDDYHLVDDHDIGDGIRFLLEHLPAHVHVLLSTRADQLSDREL